MQALHKNKTAIQAEAADVDDLDAAGSKRAQLEMKRIIGDTSSTLWEDMHYVGSLLEPFATAIQFLQVGMTVFKKDM
jgi:hypothetical protein